MVNNQKEFKAVLLACTTQLTIPNHNDRLKDFKELKSRLTNIMDEYESFNYTKVKDKACLIAFTFEHNFNKDNGESIIRFERQIKKAINGDYASQY